MYKTTAVQSPLGVRIILTWSGSADGTVAPTYITVSNLNERELPVAEHPTGIWVIPVRGLCVGGVNPDCTSVGYIVFMRKGEKVDTLNFTHYREIVYRPYVKSKKKSQEGVNKHSASRSVVEQPMDLMTIFKQVNKLVRKLTSKGRSSIFKDHIKAAFDEADSSGKISLPAEKSKCIIDFIICLPEILSTTVTSSRVVSGFVWNGMIDEESLHWPDFNKILATCRRDLSEKEVNFIRHK